MSASLVPGWGDLQVFLHTAREGTLAAAASALHINASTVQRRIGKLERELATRLFDRSQRGYSLTHAGEELYAHVQAMEVEAVTVSRKVGGHDQRLAGTIRVATVDDLAIGPLMPMIHAFSRHHPRITVELRAQTEFSNLSRRDADVAIRFGVKPSEPDVVARKLGDCDVAIYGATSYFRSHGKPSSLEEIHQHACVCGTENLARLPMERIMAAHFDPSRVVFRSESLLLRLAAVRQGLGLGFLGLFMGEKDRRLERLHMEFPEARAPLWLAVHADLRTNARVRAFSDFIYDRFHEQRADWVYPGLASKDP